jgi:hypothetical protein
MEMFSCKLNVCDSVLFEAYLLPFIVLDKLKSQECLRKTAVNLRGKMYFWLAFLYEFMTGIFEL